MLNAPSLIGLISTDSVGTAAMQKQPFGGAALSMRSTLPKRHSGPSALHRQLSAISSPTVDIAPHGAVTRRGVEWGGMAVELVQAMAHQRLDYRFRSHMHLLVAHEHGLRRDGESYIEGTSRSTLRDLTKKLTLVPAGHEYVESHESRTPTSAMYFYFDAMALSAEEDLAGVRFAPRLLFEDAAIWSIAAKLRQAIEAPRGPNRIYVEALGTVLKHELASLQCGASRPEGTKKGGLAGWQQRIVATYVQEHLSEQIPLTTLARLARLSTFHFSRAFKQSFGVSPHRYHTNQRIELAKAMLAEGKQSVTEVGLTVGFNETSSFIAVFRKMTGETPSRYQRALR
jgi:AraC family transcriptional regulator